MMPFIYRRGRQAAINILLLLSLLLSSSPAAAGDGFRVIDGDGFHTGTESVRLWGIDAPELDQECTRDGQSYECGKVAAAMLRVFIGSEPMHCTEVDRDRYGRTVARCEVGNGADLGGLMVAAGWAVDFERYSNGWYAHHQADAESARRGLWAGSFVDPRDWRKRASSR